MYPKIFKSINNDEIIVRLYNPKTDCEGLFSVLRESYMKDSNTFRVFDMNKPEALNGRLEFEEYVTYVLNEGVSVIAHHLPLDQIVGFCINTIHSRPKPGHLSPYEEFRNIIRSDNLRNLFDYHIATDKELNLFNRFNTDCIFECKYLTTLLDFRRKGIGYSLVECSVEMAKIIKAEASCNLNNNRGMYPTIVYGKFSSIYSAMIGEKLKFVVMQSTSLNELEINGIPFSSKTPQEHTHRIFSVLQI